MKHILTLFAALAIAFSVWAQDKPLRYVEATDLNIIGKAFYDTPNPYHRIDTEKYLGFTAGETNIVHCTSGLAVLFKTDSKTVVTSTKFGFMYNGVSTAKSSSCGFDLYIKDNSGKWLFAGCSSSIPKGDDPAVNTLVENMDGSIHECMIYLPSYSEILSCSIGVDEGSFIEALETPFRHRILFHGSSFTQGVSTCRPGMSYPLQFQRSTGMGVITLGMSGRSRLQHYMIPVLASVDADAYVFDTFSNPDSLTICRNIIPFIDGLVAAHPGKPLIFQRTIYREGRNFNMAKDSVERSKAEAVEKMFKSIFSNPKYKDVYLITPDASDRHETSVDGTHPDNYGYYLWEQSIEQPILDILMRYGIY